MKILVAVKRVVDYNVKVRPASDGAAVDLSNVKMALNPFCEIAVEEAVRIKEKGVADEVIAVSIGDTKAQEQLRSAMAIGVDRGILVETAEPLEPLAVAKCLRAIVEKESPDLVILGKQSIDGDNNQTGQLLAGMLDWPQAIFASVILPSASDMAAGSTEGDPLKITREIDGGLQTVEVSLPAVITCDLRLNEPRYASLPNIMKAKKKPLDVVALATLGIDSVPRVQLLGVSAPIPRSPGIIVENVDALIDKLKNEAKVI